MSPTFSSLKFRNYRLWFAGALVANVGTWMQRVAQDWLVLTELTDESGVAVGITTALQFAPVLLLSPYAGLLADRVDRRKLLIATQVGQGVLAAGLGVLVLSGHAQLWQVYLFALALGCVTAIDGPVRQTFVAELVPAAQAVERGRPEQRVLQRRPADRPGRRRPAHRRRRHRLGVPHQRGDVRRDDLLADPDAHVRAAARCRRTPRAKGQLREGIAYVRGRSDILVIMVVVGRRVDVRPELPADQRDDGAHRVRQGGGGVRDPRLGPRHRLADRGPARRAAGAAPRPPGHRRRVRVRHRDRRHGPHADLPRRSRSPASPSGSRR